MEPVTQELQVVDKRRGELLGPAEQGKVSLLPHAEKVKAATANRYRTIAQHWPDIWPRIIDATTP